MKVVIATGIIAALSIFFIIQLTVFPDEFLSQPVVKPQPIHEVKISDSEITLGESFVIKVITTNQNDYADLLITSIGFPDLEKIDEGIKVVGYDFTTSPDYIEIGTKIGSQYTFGEQIPAQHPSIEALSLNVKEKASFHMELEISPKTSGVFNVHVKTIAIPHSTDISHYPYDGKQDFQNEFVDEISVSVNP